MRALWIVVLFCAGALLLLALAPQDGIPGDRYSAHAVSENLPGSPQDTGVDHLLSPHETKMDGNKTALFSKYVASGTQYIIVSLYSGDKDDPISVTIIAPDKTLGPYYDESDGIVDGRIDLKISNPEGLTPGLWKFLIHSNKNIAYGSLENLSWIKTGTDDHKTDE